jgi:site-specific DNA-methyltransferase (adenine-specific)
MKRAKAFFIAYGSPRSSRHVCSRIFIEMPELTLYHGDCLQVMKGLPDQSVDVIICDLPYGCLTTQREKAVNVDGCSWDIAIDLGSFWKEVKRIRKNEHTPCIHFCTTKFGYDLIQSNPTEFRYDLVWDKQRGVSFLQANKMPMRSHEMIYVFSMKGAHYQRIDEKGDYKPYALKERLSTSRVYNTNKVIPAQVLGDTRCSKSVIQINKEKNRDRHPTQKPIELYEWLVRRYCPAGGTVLDPTFGSGNSVFTAYSLGYDAIGIEKDEGFFKKAEERMNALP